MFLLISLICKLLALPPDHLVDDAGVALDDFHDLGRDVFFDVLFGVDILFAVSAEQNVLALFEAEASVNVAGVVSRVFRKNSLSQHQI